MEKERIEELRAAVAARDVDIDRRAALAGFKVLRDAREIIDEVGVLAMTEMMLAAIDAILGDGASTELLGDDPRVSETLIVARALAERLSPAIEQLQEKLADLTETVAEG